MGLDWELFLYFYIAKSCFLLERKSLSVTIIGITLLNILRYYWTLLQRFQNGSTWMLNLSGSQQLWRWTLQYAVTYFAILAFVVHLRGCLEIRREDKKTQASLRSISRIMAI
jgi:hypothetical protein